MSFITSMLISTQRVDDTDFYIPVDKAIYDKWLNIEFDEQITVNAIQWVLIWDTISLEFNGDYSDLVWSPPERRSLDLID